MLSMPGRCILGGGATPHEPQRQAALRVGLQATRCGVIAAQRLDFVEPPRHSSLHRVAWRPTQTLRIEWECSRGRRMNGEARGRRFTFFFYAAALSRLPVFPIDESDLGCYIRINESDICVVAKATREMPC